MAKEAIKQIRELPAVPAGNQSLNGYEQQIVANYLDVGYVIINPVARVAKVYIANGKPMATLRYAVLVWTVGHVDVVATGGGRRCGLLDYEAMRTFLADLHITTQKDTGHVPVPVEVSDDEDEEEKREDEGDGDAPNIEN